MGWGRISPPAHGPRPACHQHFIGQCSTGKRIECTDPGSLKVRRIARNDRQLVFKAGGGDQSVGNGWRLIRCEPAPAVGDGCGDRQNPLGVVGFQSKQPAFERTGRSRIPGPTEFNSAPDFAEGQHAEKGFVRLDAGHPGRDALIAVPFSQLGDDTGVNQVRHQRAISRGRSAARGNSMGSPGGMLRR